MFNFAKSLALASLKRWPLAVILIMLQILMVLPLVIPGTTGAFIFDRETHKEQLERLTTDLVDGTYDTAPDELVALVKREIELLEIAANDTGAERIQALASLRAAQYEEFQQGYLVGGEAYSFEAEKLILEAIAKLDKPAIYETTADEPLFYFISERLGTSPYLAWLVIPIVIGFAIASARRKPGIIAQAPLSRMGASVASVCLVVFLSFFAIALALLPAAAIVAIKNGIGDPAYPIVLVHAQQVYTSTVLAASLQCFALYILGSLMFALIIEIVLALLEQGIAGALVCTLIALLPSYPGYFSELSPYSSILPYLPSTYLDFGTVCGYPLYQNSQDMLPIEGVTPALGMLVLALTCAVLAMLLILITVLSGRPRRR